MENEIQKRIGRAVLIAVQGLTVTFGILVLAMAMESYGINDGIIDVSILIVGGIGVFWVMARAHGIRFRGPRDPN
jgi:hypothetical protein